MIKKLKRNVPVLGLVFTTASALLSLLFSTVGYLDATTYARMQPYLFDCGVDNMGVLVCAALFFGCMKQEGDGGRTFRALIDMVSACFFVNLLMYFVIGVPELRIATLICILLSKLIDLVMILFFYRYVKLTLNLQGKLTTWADKGIPILMGLEILVILSNIFFPVTFQIDANGMYQPAGASWAEDIYLIVASLVTTILVIRSDS